MRTWIALGMVGLLVGGCAPKVLRVVMPEYRRKELPCTKLAVHLAPQGLEILNPDDVEDDLGPGAPEKVYLDFFWKVIPEHLRTASVCKNIEVLPDELPGLVKTDFPFPDGPVSMWVPSPGAPGSAPGDSFTLYIDSLKLSRKTLIGGGGGLGPLTFAANGGVGGPAVYGYTNYVLWDDKAGRAVAYGRPMAYAYVGWAVTRTTWHMNAWGLSREYLRDSPIRSGWSAFTLGYWTDDADAAKTAPPRPK